MALHHAIRIRSRIVRSERPAKHQKHKPCEQKKKALLFPPLVPGLVVVRILTQESVLKLPKRGAFHAAIRVTTRHCDSCAQGGLGRDGRYRGETFEMRKEALGRHVCRTKLPPKNFEIDMENDLKNTKKGPEKRSETCLNWRLF